MSQSVGAVPLAARGAGRRARACWSRRKARGRCWSKCRRWSTPRTRRIRAGSRVGLEQNRLAMLLAVLHRHAGIACCDQDVFVNAVGGVRIAEPAADLAVLLAVVSSLTRPAAAGEARRVRRSRPRRRSAPGAARPGAPEGSGEARLHACADSRSEQAEAGDSRPACHRRAAGCGRCGTDARSLRRLTDPRAAQPPACCC